MPSRAMAPDLPTRIDALPERWATRLPAGTALRAGEREMDWQALAATIADCAGDLRGAGVRAGDRVMIVAENSPAVVVALFAITRLDACAIIVNPRLTPREFDGIREHATPRRMLFARAVAAEIDAHAQRHRAAPFAATETFAISASDDACEPDPVAADEGARLAVIVYTSGTSGRPKGVMLTHANLLFVAATSARLRAIDPRDRVYGALPIYHSYGLASMLLGGAVAGASLHVVPRFDPRDALTALAHDGITIFQGVPAMYTRMLEQLPGDSPVPAPRLRFLYAGGSPLDPVLKATVERRFGCPLHNGYGLTECSPTVAQTRLDAPRSDTSVGPPIPGIDVRIVATGQPDAAAGELDAAAGGIGELWVRGPNVMQGYYRDAAATAEVITPDGWLKTGDLARRDADGALSIVGRSKELIIRSGLNVYPVEVETVLNAHPAVSQSVVVGRQLPDGNEEVIAFVERMPGRALKAGELEAHAAAGLAPYKRPAEIHVLEALPASATGKVLRGQLKALAQAPGPAR